MLIDQVGLKQQDSDAQIESKLGSCDVDEQEDAIDLIAQKISVNKGTTGHEYVLWLNNICLKLADLIVKNQTKNALRQQIVGKIFQEFAPQIELGLINRDEFLSRISHQFNTNDPQQRILSLKILQFCPGLLQNRLDIQHQILYLLTTKTVKDPKEREIANDTISKIAASSEGFAKSIMIKVEEAILSGNYDTATCQNLIQVISNVPGDSNCGLLFFETICKVVASLREENKSLQLPLLRALLKMTIKVPLLFDCVFDFLSSNGNGKLDSLLCEESIYVLSRAYAFSP